MQGLQDDLSESQNPLHVQSDHSTANSDTVQHTSGPVCLYCKKHLLEPTATICAGCGHLHRASVKFAPKESITTSQETNPPSSSGMDTQDKQFKYTPIFGAHSSAQLTSLSAGTQVETSQRSSRNQEASSETGDEILKRKRYSSSDGTNGQFVKHLRTDDMSDPAEIDPVSSDVHKKKSGAAVSDGKNESSKSPETEALHPSHSFDVGCFVYPVAAT